MDLLADDQRERSAVVANSRMNRGWNLTGSNASAPARSIACSSGSPRAE